MCALAVGPPLAGREGLHLAVHDLDGDGAVGAAAQHPLVAVHRGGDPGQDDGEDADGRRQLDEHRAAGSSPSHHAVIPLMRLVKSWKPDDNIIQPKHSELGIKWFNSRLSESIEIIDDHYSKYRISDILMTIYRLFWDDFSSWYLEIIKPDYGKPIDSASLKDTFAIFDKLLRIIHPFMPFITEELWHMVKKRSDGESIMISPMPEPEAYDRGLLGSFEELKEVTTSLRKIRKENNIPPSEAISLNVKAVKGQYNNILDPVLSRLVNISDVNTVDQKPKEMISFIVKFSEYFVPVSIEINVEEELKRLSDELGYSKGFLKGISKKLDNRSFVNNAPKKIVNIEKKKLSDTQAKIKALEEQIKNLES